MEVYFKDLISKDASLEKLVDDLSRVVQGADDLVQNLSDDSRAEAERRLDRLKDNCQRLRTQAVAGARATDRVLRRHPYTSMLLLFGVGLLVGAKIFRRK